MKSGPSHTARRSIGRERCALLAEEPTAYFLFLTKKEAALLLTVSPVYTQIMSKFCDNLSSHNKMLCNNGTARDWEAGQLCSEHASVNQIDTSPHK